MRCVLASAFFFRFCHHLLRESRSGRDGFVQEIMHKLGIASRKKISSVIIAIQEKEEEGRYSIQFKARVILQVKPRKWRRHRFFANERAVRTHRCCSSCKETALDNGIFQVLSVNAGMIAFKLQGQKYYAAKCEFRANSGDSKLYQVTAGVS